MKTVKLIGLLLFTALMLGNIDTQSQASKPKQSAPAVKVSVYYFHFTRRCNTCKSVEANAKAALESLYAAKMRSGEIQFTSLNIEEANGKALAQKLGVEGQTLLVVSGNKKVDITDKGFMYASNPDKSKEEVRKAVEQVTKK